MHDLKPPCICLHMETICYIYQQRNITEMTLEKVHSKAGEYDLIRIALPASILTQTTAHVTQGAVSRVSKIRLQHLATLLLQEQQKTGTPLQLTWDENIFPPLPDKNGAVEWFRDLPFSCFTQYRNLRFAEQLMKYGARGDYLILGHAPCIPELLCNHSRQIGSATWILPMAMCTDRIRDFAEGYYEDYGILLTLCPYLPVEIPRRIDVPDHVVSCSQNVEGSPAAVPGSISVPVPCCLTVLDFMGDRRLSYLGIPKDSIWLDMDASWQKEREIELQNPGIAYFSLKKAWKKGLLLDT